jgi:hypothetical protein
MGHHDERRRLPRRRTRLSAAAVHGAEPITVACTVRDKSESGAKILIQTGFSVPDAFHLIELTTGEMHKAQVVWRDQTFVGVTLSERCDLAHPTTPEQTRFAELRTRLTSRTGSR